MKFNSQLLIRIEKGENQLLPLTIWRCNFLGRNPEKHLLSFHETDCDHMIKIVLF